MNDYNLRPIWDATLDIYESFALLCERHNLRHIVAFGTAIGAIRHKGFIPWDDDFDVMMPRPDYEQFLLIAEKELPPWFKIVNRRKIPVVPNDFTKIFESRRDLVSKVELALGRDCPQGIFVDIFPMDALPKLCIGRVFRKFQDFMLFARSIYLKGDPTRMSIYHRIGRLLGFVSGLIFFRQRTWEGFERLRVKYSKRQWSSAGYCAHYSHTFPAPRVLHRSCLWFDDRIMVPFDRIMVPVPRGYHEFLKQQYGDYMKFPPIEQQRPVHIAMEPLKYRFGTYE